MVTIWFYYDRTLLKIVSSFDVSSHFWFLLCPHNLRPLLRSRPLTWAWSLLSTCSVINLMNKHTETFISSKVQTVVTRRRRDLFLLGAVPDMPTGGSNGRFLLDLPALNSYLAFCSQFVFSILRPATFACPLFFIY